MPGELGNEDEQQQVGYYEHRYVPCGDPNIPPPGIVDSWEGTKPRGSVLMRIMKKVKDDKEKEHKHKG